MQFSFVFWYLIGFSITVGNERLHSIYQYIRAEHNYIYIFMTLQNSPPIVYFAQAIILQHHHI